MNNLRDSDKTQLRGTLELISFSGVSIEVKVTHRIIRKIKWMASSMGHCSLDFIVSNFSKNSPILTIWCSKAGTES